MSKRALKLLNTLISFLILFSYSCSPKKETKPINLSQTDSLSKVEEGLSDTLSAGDRAKFVEELRESKPLLLLLAKDTGASAERAKKLLEILKAEEKRIDKEVEALLKEAGEQAVEKLEQTAKTFPETPELREIREAAKMREEAQEREAREIRETIKRQEEINRLRAEVIKTYKVNTDGVIGLPGSFEGQFLYVPYFYERWEKGIYEKQELAEDSISGYAVIKVTNNDKKIFPELELVKTVFLGRDKNGYIHATTQNE